MQYVFERNYFAGFDNFYYLYPYDATLNDFNIPHDLKILKVFNVKEVSTIKVIIIGNVKVF